eukprot:10043414-Prorocentrum_lima.AAC.1
MRSLHRRCTHLAPQLLQYDPRGPFTFPTWSSSSTITRLAHYEYVDDLVIMFSHPRAQQLLDTFTSA